MTDLLLEATGVAKHYGAVAALRSASLAVRPGEVHALMGANGAGKSTLVKILTGAVRPDARHDPRPRQGRTSPARRREARRGGHRVRLPGAVARSRTSTSASNLRLTRTPVEPFRHWLAELGIAEPRPRRLRRGDLPLATLRIIDLARALALEPDVLMLDEMTAALPADLTERVLEVIGRQRGTRPLGHLHLPPDDRDRAPCATAPRSCAKARRSASSTSTRARRSGSSR